MTLKTLSELAAQLQGECIGNPTLEIRQVVHPSQATSAEDLALILDKSVEQLLAQKQIQTALVPEGVEIPTIPNQIRVKRPKVALAKLLEIFERPAYIPPGIHPSAVIDPTATIGNNVNIGPFCSIGPNTVIGEGTRLVSHVSIGANVTVGENCLFYAGVVLGDRVQVGNRVIIQPNAAIGNDGFSYVTAEAGSVESARSTGKVSAQNTQILRINSIGTVVLEDEVEIGANSTIDRATLGETRIKRGSKIDNQVQVAHNVIMGENCLLAAQVGIAGSVTIGDRVVMAGQAGIKDHTTIGHDAIILPKSGATADVPPKTILAGLQGMPRKEFLRKEMQMKRALALPQKFEDLERRVEALESQNTPVEQPV